MNNSIPTPTWKDDEFGVYLYHADCMDILPQLPKVDAVVTDPPYGIGESNKNFASRGKLANADKYERLSWDDKIQQDAIDLARTKSEFSIIFGGNFYNLPKTSCWLVWDKDGPANDFADCELAWTNMKKAVRRIRYLWNGCMRMERHVPRVHPTQKPIAVMEWAIGNLPMSNGYIIDPFMGSGTTGVACVRLGRKFIGIEKEKKYFDICVKRISEAIIESQGGEMFAKHKPSMLFDSQD